MSRYRKVVTGETELPEVSGIKFVIYPTIETRMELLEHIKSTQVFDEIDVKDSNGKVISTKRVKGTHFNLAEISKTLSRMVYEGCFSHDSEGNRLKLKEEELETTQQQILSLILESDIMALYVEVLKALDIVSSKKAEELQKGQESKN